MVIQVVNFNLEGIGHQDYLGATVDVAPAFNDVKGLKSKVWLSDEAVSYTHLTLPTKA